MVSSDAQRWRDENDAMNTRSHALPLDEQRVGTSGASYAIHLFVSSRVASLVVQQRMRTCETTMY